MQLPPDRYRTTAIVARCKNWRDVCVRTAGTACTQLTVTTDAYNATRSSGDRDDGTIYCPMPFQPDSYSVCCRNAAGEMRCCQNESNAGPSAVELSYVYFRTHLAWSDSVADPSKTRCLAVAERPRDASCHWIFRLVTQGHWRSFIMTPLISSPL